jgi:ParB family chromosome partitioning protein
MAKSDIRKKLEGKHSKLGNAPALEPDHPASLNNYSDGAFYQLPLEAISPDPGQPRKTFDEQALEELSQSIKQNGVLQPVIVRAMPEQANRFLLVAGERRWRASKIAGLESIPAIISKGNPREISLIENIQRENLKPIEEAEAFREMIEQHGYTQEQLAQAVGKARTTVTEVLSLTRLPAALREECRRADIPRRILVEVAKQKSEKAMLALFSRVRLGGLKGDQVREITRSKGKEAQGQAVAMLFAIDRFSQSLGKLTWDTMEIEERAALLDNLQQLRDRLDDLISGTQPE